MPVSLKISLCFTICMLSRYAAFTQDIHFTTVNPPKENQWSPVYSMTQDPQGYLWMATQSGLYKYDGKTYSFYQHAPNNANSLASDFATSVFSDKEGLIWAGTWGAGLDRFDPVKNKFTHYRHRANDSASLLSDTIDYVFRDREGAMWVGTLHGLDKLDPETGKFKHFIHNANDPGSLSNNQVRIIYEDRSGTIWVGTGSPFMRHKTPKGEGGLNKFDRRTGKFTRYMHDPNDPHTLIDNRVDAIFEDSKGTFWVGTAGDGLHIMDRKTGKFERHLYDPVHPETLSRPPLTTKKDIGAVDHIRFINEDNSGRIWIGTYQNGINVYDPKTKKTVWYGDGSHSREKLSRNSFWNAYKTRDGVLWFNSTPATYPVFAMFKVNPYQYKPLRTSVGKWVNAFTEDTAGTLWLATDKGLICEGPGNKREIFKIDKKGAKGENDFPYIEKDKDNKLWLASRTGGLSRFDPVSRVFTIYHHQKAVSNSLISDNVGYVKKGAPGKLWVGTNNGLDLMDTKTATFKHFLNSKKDSAIIGTRNIIALETDNNNNVWVGTLKGLVKLDENTGRYKKYLSGIVTNCLLNDSEGNLWIATDYGLYKYDKTGDSFSAVDINTRLFWGIAEDQNKSIWLNASTGVIKLNTQNNEWNVYGINAGVNARMTTNFGYRRHNGDILFGDTAGYFTFQPGKLLHSTPAANVVISDFLLNDVPIIPVKDGILRAPVFNTSNIRLNHDQASFSFAFNIIDFVGEQDDIRTYYMLENYDNKWRKANADGLANFYNIPPGQYTFKLKSVNANGLVTEKQIAIIISPPWWQTWWAYTLFVLAFAGSIWGFIYYRSRALIKEKRILEHKVHVRTEEVMQQKEEIEAQRDGLEKAFKDLKTTQTQLIQSEKMASLGELTAGIAHEIQNPLNFVNNFSEVSKELMDELREELIKGDTKEADVISKDVIQNLEKIVHHGKRADAIVKGMLQHSQSGSGAKESTNINALADEYMRLSYHGLRSKDKNFNADLLTNFDEKLPKINAIPQDIGRVLLNLFNNAFYAINQKSKIAGVDYKPEVSVSTASENGQVVIKVKDNGIGMPDAIKEKIMQPFFTTKPTGEGTGLGLSLTYDMVVKGHGGSIQVNSKEGEGSEFIILLPLS